MARVCTNCGTEAAEGDRFCSACGTALETGEGAERKLATMVFVDLVGSTEIAAGSDPEDLRGRLEPFFETARASLREHGGTIEKYVGDAVLAVFGVPQAHGDDPDRAIAAALDLAERVANLDQALAVRIGIEAGEVLAQDGGGDLSVTGEAVNAAARLQQAAAPGEVLVGERAMRYCRRAQLEPHAEVKAKGMPGPLPAWRALAGAAAPSAAPATPLLGREDDLDLLRLVYRRSVRERRPEIVIITGEAGIGKTRLAGELLGELRAQPDPPRVLLGRNPPYGRGIAFWALAEILRAAAGLGEDAAATEVEASIARQLADLGAADAAEVARALSVSLGRKGVDHGGEGELKHAWRRFVALLADQRPLVLGIDDAHWADDGLLDLLEEAAFRVQSAPLLLLCTSRPELAERRPDFGRTTGNVTQIELRPLRAEAATELIELLLPEDARGLARRAAEATGGNPFFAEEVARRIVEEPEAALAERLPDTVQAAIAARIDLLPAVEKCALQYASVIGHHFGTATLAELLGESPGATLEGLERRALVLERLAAGPGQYSFRHQLIRDVAYSSLPKVERAVLHERVAAQIQGGAEERIAELAELISFHLARAAELDPSPERTETACRATFAAAEAAARRGAVERGQQLFEQVAKLETDDAMRMEPLRAAADLALRRWRGDQALVLLREEAATAERAGDAGAAASAYARAVEVAGRMSGISGRGVSEEEVRSMLRKGQQLVTEADRETRTRLLLDEHWVAWRFGRPQEMSAPAAAALEMARELGDVALLSSALDAATADDWNRGRQREAVEHSAERLRLLKRAPHSHALEIEHSDALHMMTECLLQAGDFREAARYAAEASALDQSRGLGYLAWERELLPGFFLGDWDRTVEMGKQFREEWNAAGGPPVVAWCTGVATIGAIYGIRAETEEAAEWFKHTRTITPNLEASGQLSGLLMLEAHVELHHGQAPRAAEMLEDPLSFDQWWLTPYLASRAEAFVRSERPDAETAIEEAEALVGEHLYAQGILLRARGIGGEDEELLRESLALFERIDCPYEAARSGWLLGGEAKRTAAETFERLGAVSPG
jgi:class 3 adenylate cyclase